MREFFKSVRFKILLGLLALMLGLMLYAASTSASTLPSAILGAIVSPIQRLSMQVSSAVRSSLDRLASADLYSEENEMLKEKLSEWNVLSAELEKVKEENRRLREVIGLKEEHPDISFSPPATIIARNMADAFVGFAIDQGGYAEVSIHDPVVTEYGLVGYISEVAPTYSRVTSILSPELKVYVQCVRTQDDGVVMGDLSLAQDGFARMGHLDLESDLMEGDILVTAGQSGIFPQGQVVGTVVSVGIEDSGLSRYAIVKPAVDFDRLSGVFVITGFQGQGLGYDD